MTLKTIVVELQTAVEMVQYSCPLTNGRVLYVNINANENATAIYF